ncbi:MAG: hypothetical protein ACXWV0_02915 [Flavisolibacter sp.]
MQKNNFPIMKTGLKLTAAALILMITSSVMVAFKAKSMYADIWQQLGVSKNKGEENIKASFLNGYFHYYGAEKAKHIISGNRAAIAKDLMEYTKQQINSAAFKKEYDQMRSEAKPEAPTEQLITKEEMRKKSIAEIEKSITELEKSVKISPDMAKALQPVLDMQKLTLKDYKDPKSQTIDLLYSGEVYQHESRIRSFEERLAEWEKDYPVDYRIVVKERLEHFIKLAKSVDFNAELKTVRDKKKFVNSAYENKPDEWKQIFRAGKEVIAPAISFAEQWVKELKTI